jgi:Fe-S-cluster-containing dehydrogenase component
MSADRRSFLKGMVGVGAAAAASAVPASASTGPKQAPDDAVGLLYDTTLCIGCKTCVVACREANGLDPDTSENPLHDMPTSLNAQTKNIIKLHTDEDGRRSYMKQQCMHCIDPACVGACMIGSFQKREYGIVTWDPDRCIGCRYCQVACPFEIPKFQWASATPKIVKCELCNHRLAEGKEPGCTEVCPREAVIYGTHKDLLEEAHRRIAENPARYYTAPGDEGPRVYGETDGGGTQCLYLSHVPFEDLGLPDLGEESHPVLSRTVQHGIYQGFVAPVALYAVLGGVMFRNRRAARKEAGDE